MTVWPGKEYRYFSIDSADDLTGSPLLLGSTRTTIATAAELVAVTPARLAAVPPTPAAGLTRYWWRCLAGVGTPLPLAYGTNTVYGQLTDNPEVLPLSWSFTISRS